MTTRAARHPAQRENVEAWITSKGVKWTFSADFDTEEINLQRSLRNQARLYQVTNPETVETYTAAVKRGDNFPAIIIAQIDNDWVVVDGNHRLVSYLGASKPTIPVYMLRDVDTQTIVLMTFEANATHGLPTSKKERLRHAIYLIDNNAQHKDAAAALNLNVSDVTLAYAKEQADRRAHKLHIPTKEWEHLATSSRARFNSLRNDETFVRAASISHRARLNSDEIGTMITLLNKERSAKGQESTLDTLEDSYATRIKQGGGGVVKRAESSPKALFMAHIGYIINRADDLDEIVHGFAEAERAEAATKCENAILALNNMAALLRRTKK